MDQVYLLGGIKRVASTSKDLGLFIIWHEYSAVLRLLKPQLLAIDELQNQTVRDRNNINDNLLQSKTSCYPNPQDNIFT